MKKTFKRIMTLQLVISLLFAEGTPALAKTVCTPAETEIKKTNCVLEMDQVETGESPVTLVKNIARETDVKADILKFEEIGIINGVKSISVDCSNADIVYELEFENYTDEITVRQNDDEMLDMIVRQDDIINEVQVESDNTLMVDGYEYDSYSSTDAQLDGVRPVNMIVSDCPYGKESDYSYKLGSGKKADIRLEKAIELISVVAFEAIIAREYNIPTKAVVAFDVVYAGICAYNPDTTGISCKYTNYAHRKYKDTYIKPIDMYVYKMKCTWYTETNFKGVQIPQTCYYTKRLMN